MKRSVLLLGFVLVGCVLLGHSQPPTKEYIYVLRPGRADLLVTGHTPAERVTQDRHQEYLAALVKRGSIILYGRTLTTDESTFGIVVFRAESDEQARAIMNGDPGVKDGLMKATLYPYRVAYRDTSPR